MLVHTQLIQQQAKYIPTQLQLYRNASIPVTVQDQQLLLMKKVDQQSSQVYSYLYSNSSSGPMNKESATAGKQGQAQTSQIVFDIPDTDATTLNFAKGETSEVIKRWSTKSEFDKSTLTSMNGKCCNQQSHIDGEGKHLWINN